MSPFVELTYQGPVAHIALKRPDKLNALDRDMVDALAEAARAIEASRETRAAILVEGLIATEQSPAVKSEALSTLSLLNEGKSQWP